MKKLVILCFMAFCLTACASMQMRPTVGVTVGGAI